MFTVRGATPCSSLAALKCSIRAKSISSKRTLPAIHSWMNAAISRLFFSSTCRQAASMSSADQGMVKSRVLPEAIRRSVCSRSLNTSPP
jgi:hypothetical protein